MAENVNIWNDMQQALAALEQQSMRRTLREIESPIGPRVRIGGGDVVCLCSNDYLCLAADEAVKAAAIDAVRTWGVGAGASRLVSGTMTPHRQLENRLSAFKGTEAAIVTSTGWAANHVALAALAARGDLVLCDKLDHASILDAALACGATVRTYAHRDVSRLETLLDRHRGGHRRCVIVTDSIFSMDGDLAPLGELAALKKRFDAVLLIDEAHATGVLGPGGRGAAELLGVEREIDVVVGTLSKALGAMGGFVAGPAALIDTIINTARAFIYTSAPAPAICAAAVAALEIIEKEPARRQRLLATADRLRDALGRAGLATGDSRSPIMPIIIGDAGAAVRLSQHLLAEGFLVPAIRPPTVPRGTSRLRVSLCCDHAWDDLERFVRALTDAGCSTASS